MTTEEFDRNSLKFKKINSLMWLYDITYKEAKAILENYSDFALCVLVAYHSWSNKNKPDEYEITKSMQYFMNATQKSAEILKTVTPYTVQLEIAYKVRKQKMQNILKGEYD